MSEPAFEVVATDDLVIDRPPLMKARALLSPYVWRDGEGFLLLLRAMPPGDGISGRIWLGRSDDGLRFRFDETPLIEPTLPHLDIGGCEDPTVVVHDSRTFVFYTGVDERGRGEMLLARGDDVTSLIKRGVAYSCSRTELNTKEATVDLSRPGWWRLFFEFAHGGRSCIGLATGRGPEGPWTEHADPIEARADRFDCYHLSTGPLLDLGGEGGEAGDLLMFYNGADENARWSIGWATFDRETLALRHRCDLPLIAPPASAGAQIVFAASALPAGNGLIHLYYSRDDETPRRATIRRL